MKIAICGAHGVGKTTISKLIAEHLNITLLPDIVVDAYNLGFTINEETPIETQIWLTAKQIENERKHNKFIADKCIFDYHIYAKALGMDQEIISLTEKIAIKTGSYNHIFFIRPEFEIDGQGGKRSTDINFQNNVNNAYESFLRENDIPFTIITGSIEDRKQQILNKIN